MSPHGLRGYISSFVVIDEKVAVIDPGPESAYDRLREALDGMGVRPDYVIATHVHLDHAGAAAHLLRDFPGAVAYAHPRGVAHIVDPSKLYEASTRVAPILPQAYGRPLAADPSRVLAASDGQVISLGNSALRVVHTPGHASHHMSLLLEPDGVLFTGDSAGVIFRFGGREIPMPTTPAPFKPKMYLESIRKMEALSPRSFAPTHFGIYDDAAARLEFAAAQVVNWLNALAGVRGGDLSEAIRAVQAVDRHVDDLLSLQDVERFAVDAFLSTTIYGLLDAIRSGEWP